MTLQLTCVTATMLGSLLHSNNAVLTSRVRASCRRDSPYRIQWLTSSTCLLVTVATSSTSMATACPVETVFCMASSDLEWQDFVFSWDSYLVRHAAPLALFSLVCLKVANQCTTNVLTVCECEWECANVHALRNVTSAGSRVWQFCQQLWRRTLTLPPRSAVSKWRTSSWYRCRCNYSTCVWKV